MGILQAAAIAASGLKAVAVGTETVAANIANASTPGYARREVSIAAQRGGTSAGGVEVLGISRAVKAGVLAEVRTASAAAAGDMARTEFYTRIEAAVGLPGEASALTTAVTNLRNAISHAAIRPDDELRLTSAIAAADNVATKINSIAAILNDQRVQAEVRIGQDIQRLNVGLMNVAELNRAIAKAMATGDDASSLNDARQAAIDAISSIVPVQEVSRSNGQVALFTTGGAALLDGAQPVQLSFHTSPALQSGDTGPADLATISIDGSAASARQMQMLTGGSLSASFQIRDDLAPQFQAKLDTLASELRALTSGPQIDPDLAIGQDGLFSLQRSNEGQGAAVRLTVNSEISAAPWKLRDGVTAIAQSTANSPSILNALSAALDGRLGAVGTGFQQRSSEFEASVVSARVMSGDASTQSTSRLDAGRLIAAVDAVDIDVETQLLLQYERAFAANARVIQAVDEMMASLLRI